MTRYTPVGLGDMARINDALRTVELSLLWYGTRDPSPGRLRRFVVEQGAADLEEAMDLLRVRTEAGTRSASGLRTRLWLRGLRRLVFQVFGRYPGKVWVEEQFLREVLDLCTEFVSRTAKAAVPPSDDELALLKHRAALLHARASRLVPVGRPRTSLRFFGCESYGRSAFPAEGGANTDGVRREQPPSPTGSSAWRRDVQNS
jgi:hypothetical protein